MIRLLKKLGWILWHTIWPPLGLGYQGIYWYNLKKKNSQRHRLFVGRPMSVVIMSPIKATGNGNSHQTNVRWVYFFLYSDWKFVALSVRRCRQPKSPGQLWPLFSPCFFFYRYPYVPNHHVIGYIHILWSCNLSLYATRSCNQANVCLTLPSNPKVE